MHKTYGQKFQCEKKIKEAFKHIFAFEFLKNIFFFHLRCIVYLFKIFILTHEYYHSEKVPNFAPLKNFIEIFIAFK